MISPESQRSSPGQDLEDIQKDLGNSGSGKNSPQHGTLNLQEVMLNRFYKTKFADLPECDKEDFFLQQTGEAEQAAPEFAQECYSLLLSQEVPVIGNYLAKKRGAKVSQDEINESDRDHCVGRIFELCKEKGYRIETYFLAASIFDRFLAQRHD